MSKKPAADELREEYDFTPQQFFPDSESVTKALRALAEIIRSRERRSA